MREMSDVELSALDDQAFIDEIMREDGLDYGDRPYIDKRFLTVLSKAFNCHMSERQIDHVMSHKEFYVWH
jgi:hypothetical protein